MISSWWFQLYTKKNLLSSALICPVLILLDLIIPDYLQVIVIPVLGGVFFWIIFKFFNTVTQMRDNYELLLNSFTVKEIIRAWFFHSFITLLFFALILHLSYFILGLTEGMVFLQFQSFIKYFSFPYIYLFFFLLSFIQLLIALNIPKEMERGKKSILSFRSIFGLAGIYISSLINFIVGIVFSLLGFSFSSIMIILGMGIVFSTLSVRTEFLARRTDSLFAFKGTFRGIYYNLIVCIPSFIVAAYLSSLSFENSNLNKEQKVMRYELGSPFVSLDRQSLIDIHPYLDGAIKVSVNFDMNHEFPEFFLENKLMKVLYSHLRYGKPNTDFLVRLYDDFEVREEEWKKFKDYPTIRYVAFNAWPGSEELPERFIKQKKSLRDPATKED